MVVDVHFVRSRTVTLAAHIRNPQFDLMPADLSSVLLSHLSGSFYRCIEGCNFQSEDTQYSIPHLINVIETLQCRSSSEPASDSPIVRRSLSAGNAAVSHLL